VCGAPPESMWLQDGVILGLMQKVNIPAGSSEEVKKVCRDVLASIANDTRYDAKASGAKGKNLIMDCTPQAEVVYEALESGLSTTQTAVLVNEWRAALDPPLDAVSWSAVEGFILRSTIIERSRRVCKKSGKDD
ncbi:hypothetical protein B484DRAFT_314135, partial [Ochromonadaceae sp. CCMP2298]